MTFPAGAELFGAGPVRPIPLHVKGSIMPNNESWYDAEARKRREAKEKHERDDLEYDRQQAEDKAARAAADARRAQDEAKRERYAHQEETEIIRSELSETETELNRANARLLLMADQAERVCDLSRTLLFHAPDSTERTELFVAMQHLREVVALARQSAT